MFQTKLLFFFIFLLILHYSSQHKLWPTLSHLRAKTAEEDQALAVKQLIERLLPLKYSQQFVVDVNASFAEDGHDVFVLETLPDDSQRRLLITGNTGVSAAAGFYYYLKTYCGCHVSWSGDQLSLPDLIPLVERPLKIIANDLFRYYQNVCTSSYSFVWWDWKRWEREIDWMALNWINLPLAFNGQEEIYRRVFMKLGFAQEELDKYFTGPAFLAWGRMGNLDGWGGPLPESWYGSQLQLQHKILSRMRSFGMIPVLPAFAGHVPAATEERFPDVNVTRLGAWNSFNATYLLDQSETLFETIGKNFVVEMVKEFGTDHIYNCDTFNELTPPSTDPEYISNVSKAVYGAMLSADSEAVWLIQGWLFLNPFWTPTLVRAYVTSVPIGRMVVLDLHADVVPLYQDFESYYGQPFIWCMLHNFGGTKGLYGAIQNINEGPFKGRSFPNSTMIGTGLTPEGIEQNDVMYEFMNEMAWRTEPVNLGNWVGNYAVQRYGSRNDNVTLGWIKLFQSAYNCTQSSFHGRYILVNRPAFNRSTTICYDKQFVLDAFTLFANASAVDPDLQSSYLFAHDLVDVAREVLVSVLFEDFYTVLNDAFTQKNASRFQEAGHWMLKVLYDLENVLRTDKNFLLGNWLESAKALSESETEKALYEYNARNQITLWGPNGEILDYATKQWSGVVINYYLPRWSLFIDRTWESLNSSKPFHQDQFNKDVFIEVEQPFTFDKSVFAVESSGSSIDVIIDLHQKWNSFLSSFKIMNVNRNRNSVSRYSEELYDGPMIYSYDTGSQIWKSGS